jgi:predicted alpha/beta-fold hydrolase
LPFLGNPHVQTLLGHWWRGPEPEPSSRIQPIRLPDGDQLVLHDSLPPHWQPGGRIALLVHGLGGCHRSGPMVRMAAELRRRGLRVVRMDLRGAGRGVGLARRLYNGGCSDDLRQAAAAVHCWDPEARLILIGTSLGGNIVLKLAGEAALQPVAGLERAAAVAPPVDLERSAELLAARRNRLYETHFIRCLTGQVAALHARVPEGQRIRWPRRLTLRTFDELYTAPRGGFAGALDYYRRSSSLPLLARITVPTFIVTARDDPFVAAESLESFKAPGHITVRLVARGGHLGFLGWDGAGGVRWAERRLVDWATGGEP